MLETLSLITFCSLVQEIRGSNSTVVATYTPTYPKVVITICIAVFAIVVAVIVAKIANVCHDRHVIEDDGSDISDNTRSIIKARLSLISMQRRARTLGFGQKFFKLWSKKVNARSNASLTKESSSSSEKSASTIINVEEAMSKHGKNNKNTKTSPGKLSILLSNKIANGPESKSQNSPQSKGPTNNASVSDTKTNSTANSSDKTITPRPPSAKRSDSFVGPNVSRSDSIPNASNVSPTGKRRDVTSATAVSINLPNGNNKAKKSVTFEDEVRIKSNSSTKASNTYKSTLKKT